MLRAIACSLFVLLLAAPSAHAQRDVRQYGVCADRSETTPPAERIASCTAFLERSDGRRTSRAALLHYRALTHRGLGAVERALADLDEALRIHPRFAAAALDRGFLHASHGDAERAMADYNRALELNASYAEAFRARGVALFDRAEY